MSTDEILKQRLIKAIELARKGPMWGFVLRDNELTGAVVTYGPLESPYLLISGIDHPELPARLKFIDGKTVGVWEATDGEPVEIEYPEFNIYKLLDPLIVSRELHQIRQVDSTNTEVDELITGYYSIADVNEAHKLEIPKDFLESPDIPGDRQVSFTLDRSTQRLKYMKQPDLNPYQDSEITVRYEYPVQ